MNWFEKFLSRKLFLIVFSMWLVTAMAFAAAKWAGIAAVYMTFVGAIVSLAGIYAGANISHHWVNGKLTTNVGKGRNSDDDSGDEEPEPEEPKAKKKEEKAAEGEVVP